MKKVLLLVDDTLTIRAFEKIALGAAYDFLEASNGQMAVEIASQKKPDCILLDVTMPVMDGLEALKQLKAKDTTKSIPVIMVTTRSEDEMRQQCRALGAESFVTKPVERDELRARVREALGTTE